MESLGECSQLLQKWQDEIFNHAGMDPIPVLTSVAELIERETETYLKMPIDPFDERHPSRANPSCSLGQILKALFKNDNFMSTLTTEYILSRSDFNMHVISCRLLLDILPGLESSVVFMESETLVEKLIDWSESAEFPLNSYATGLLAAAMEVAEISSKYRERNNQLVPIMLDRLRDLTPSTSTAIDDFDLHPQSSATRLSTKRPYEDDGTEDQDTLTVPSLSSRKYERRSSSNLIRSPLYNECSNSSWAETHLSGSYQMHPLNVIMQQRFILQYLTTMGYFQEMLVHMFEQKALSHILYFINWRKNQDTRLAFDALKFLASLLTHKKFSLEFLNHGGLQQLLKVNRQAMASSGVGICLYYLALNEDVMERICWMPHPENGTTSAVEEMVKYSLWLLESSHDSSRCHATMFFSLCFKFPLLLRLFDNDNGLRKLLNVISVKGLFSDDPTMDELSEDEVFSRRQTARHVCHALKKYARAHFIKETLRLTRTNGQSDNECKPLGLSDESVLDCVEIHRQGSVTRHNWRALDKLVQEEGITYILKLIAHYSDENVLFTGKTETIRNALEVLLVCSLAPKVQNLLLKETIRVDRDDPQTVAVLKVIVMCADPKKMYAPEPKEVDCLKSALNILINLVSTNLTRVPNTSSMTSGKANISISTPTGSIKTNPGSSKKRSTVRNFIDFSAKLRNAIWKSNGTMILPKLLTTPSRSKCPTDADSIRALACRVLCGLAKEEKIRQILSKSPLFLEGELQTLMKEPILQEKKNEHATFCKFCKELIELVTGTPVTSLSGEGSSVDEIKRRLIASQTRIEYHKEGLYNLLHKFLLSENLTESAAVFFKEAKLTNVPNKISHNTTSMNTFQNRLNNRQFSNPGLQSSPSSNNMLNEVSQPTVNGGTIPTHFKLNKSISYNLSFTQQTPRSSAMQKIDQKEVQPIYSRMNRQQDNQNIELDYIIKEYLRNLHGRCKNPVATCPPFDLLAPHCCPEPSNRRMAPLNIASRIRQRQIYPPCGGMNGAKYDRQYIYSKFRPLKLVRDSIDARTNNSTCCAFSHVDHFLFVGTQNGLLKAFNVSTGLVEASYDCHNGPLGYIGPSKDGSLIITTSPVSATPVCLLWTFTDIFERKLKFDNDIHAEFGKTSSQRVISTQELYARLWDVTTGQMIQKYECNHKYLSNRATMSYDDNLVLNDGTLWDVRSGSVVHEFGKYNERISGIFHPNGNEIISNFHIWDLRNFRLLREVHAFDGCQLSFNSTGDVIFSTIIDDQMEEPPILKNEFKTSFRTFDSHDYSTIATIDLKRTISDLAVNPTDEYIALVESSGNLRYSDYMMESNVCRIYEIGRSKYREDIDMAEEEDQDEDEDVDDEDDDDEDDEDDDEDDEDVANLDFEDDYEIMDTDEENDESEISSVNSGSEEDELVAPFRFGPGSDNPDSHTDNVDNDRYGDDDDDEYEDIDEI